MMQREEAGVEASHLHSRAMAMPMPFSDKLQRLLSRQVYYVATIREVLAALSDAEWDELDNALLRHLVDGFLLRGELANAWKLLMLWFRDKLAPQRRDELFAHLCHTYLLHNDAPAAYRCSRC